MLERDGHSAGSTRSKARRCRRMPTRPPSAPRPARAQRAPSGQGLPVPASRGRPAGHRAERAPPPPPPHLVAVGTVALAEDHDAVRGDEVPHAELQPVPVREPGLYRRRRHGGKIAFAAAAALTLGHARPFRSRQQTRRADLFGGSEGGTKRQGGLSPPHFRHKHYESL